MGVGTREVFREAAEALRRAGVESPLLEARALIEYVLDAKQYLWPRTIDEDAASRVRELVGRRVTREPLQHILGTQWFMGLELAAGPAVMCVRPETEVMTQWAIEWLSPRNTARVLDLCTGSGAIALAIADRVPAARVTAVELSTEACRLARANASALSLPVTVIEADATVLNPRWLATFDLVISNPPYVPPRELPPEVAYDPAMALWGGGRDGLDIPSRIMAVAARYLIPGGALVVEHDDTQGASMRALAVDAGLINARTFSDLAGRDRFVVSYAPATMES
ncbi:MAG: peptide chain release factor N(5)-glutamine methyltransferase [Actinomycetaceae bacterium]|nr:peptide chain release factor N(5)-glutamine methyltransferase [Actinomycetaceae bacterium]